MSAHEIILGLLQNVQDPNANIRRPAEDELTKYLENISHIVPILLSIVSSNQPIHIQQLCLLIINQQIKSRFHEFTTEIKGVLVNFTVQIITSASQIPTRGILAASVSILARIASFGRPSEFEQVLNHIASLLPSQLSSNPVSSGNIISCFLEISQDVDYSKLLQLLNVLAFRMTEIFNQENRANLHMQRHGAKLMTQASSTLLQSRMTGVFELQEDELLQVGMIMQLWVQNSLQWLSNCSSISSMQGSELAVLVEILQSLPLTIEAFPDECSTYFPSISQSCWNLLCAVKDIYMRDYVYQDLGYSEDGYTSDGDRYDICLLTKHAMNVMNITVLSLRPEELVHIGILGHTDTESLFSFIEAIVQLCYLPCSSQNRFITDGNTYLPFDEEDEQDSSIRHASADLLRGISTSSLNYILPTVFQISMSFLPNINQQNSNFLSVILGFEACLWAIGSLSKLYIKAKTASESLNSSSSKLSNKKKKRKDKEQIPDITEHLKHIITTAIGVASSLITASGNEGYGYMLHSRAVWLYVKYQSLLPVEIHSTLIAQCLLHLPISIHSKSSPLAYRLIVEKALAELFKLRKDKNNQPSSIVSHIPDHQIKDILSSCLLTLPETDTRTIHYPVEAIDVLILQLTAYYVTSPLNELPNFQNYLTVDTLNAIIDSCLEIWNKYRTDPLAIDVADELLTRLQKLSARLPNEIEYMKDYINLSLSKKILPFFCNLLNQYLPNSYYDHRFATIWEVCCQQVSKLVSCIKSEPNGTPHNQSEGYLYQSVYELLWVLIPVVHSNIPNSFNNLMSNQLPNNLPALKEVVQIVNVILSSSYSRPELLLPSPSHQQQFMDCSLSYIRYILTSIEYQTTSTDIQPKGVEEISSCIPTCCGLLVHVLLFNDHFNQSASSAVFSDTIGICMRLIRHSTATQFVKIYMISVVIQLITRRISAMKIYLREEMDAPMLSDVLTYWGSVHNVYSTHYCNRVSALGLCEVLLLLHRSSQVANHQLSSKQSRQPIPEATYQAYSVSVMHLLLQSLPSILQAEEEALLGRNNVDSSDDEEDDLPTIMSDYLSEEHDETEDMSGDNNKDVDTTFLPADDYYLSDQLVTEGEGEMGRFRMVNVSETFVFSKTTNDPLSVVSLQDTVIETIVAMCTKTVSGFTYPIWFSGLSEEDMRLVEAFVRSKY